MTDRVCQREAYIDTVIIEIGSYVRLFSLQSVYIFDRQK